MEMSDQILIIGHPKSGKTTFITQFFTRAKKRKGSIVLRKMPGNIKAINNAEKRLASGEEPITTSAEENVEIVLPILVDGKNIDLICPDYGGEQVNDLTALMEIDEKWNELVNSSEKWLLFVRPHQIIQEYDLSITRYDQIEKIKSKVFTVPELSFQSKLIELLQVLIYAKGKGVRHSIREPKLSIVLTCWDELNTDNTPRNVLRMQLPLFKDFVETVWDNDSLKIFGLSAQEFPLTTMEAKDKYLDDLPENFGYMVDQDGTKDKDLTNLIRLAIQ